MLHCKKFKFDDIWVLEPDNLFENRKLYIGVCPVCHKEVAELVQNRKTDNTKFTTQYTESKFKKILLKEQYNILYKYSNFKAPKKVLWQWIYGVSKQGLNGVKHYACDFFGTKKLLST